MMGTKTRINWKARQARISSLMSAMELCLDFARVKHNRSIERVAGLMGIASHWTLYKYVSEGRLPIHLISAFEHACGCTYLTEFIAVSANKLVINVPTGKRASAEDINQLQASFSDAVSALLKFYADELDSKEVLGKINQVMADMAGHRANVMTDTAPEFDFGGEL